VPAADAVGGRPAPIVLGYGINVSTSAFPPELAPRATSLETELGRTVDRAAVLVETLAALARRYTDLPLLLVGGGVGGIKGGQHVRYPKRTPLTNLLLTMLDKANVQGVESLGDSTKRLDLPSA